MPQSPNPTFGQGHTALTTLKTGMNYVADKVYGSEGTRYLTEQTVGFTIPRMIQQLFRNEDITGTLNTIAAWEMFARDISADLMDTIAPGLMARFAIGAGIDYFSGTLTKRMMGRDAIQLYQHTAQNAKEYSGFVTELEKKLKAFATEDHGTTIKANLNLEQKVDALINRESKKGLGKAIDATAKELADALKLNRLDVEFAHPYPDNTSKTVSMTLNELVGDLKALKENYTNKHTSKGLWHQVMPNVLEKTRKMSQWHMAANVVALVGSLAVPLLIRMATKAMTGVDAFPGTTALRKHFNRHDAKANQEAEAPGSADVIASNLEQEAKKKESLVWFPYLKECWEKGKWKPIAITTGFFAVLLGTVYRNQFLSKGMKKLNWKNIVKAYEFDRGFPWTTVAQMELTYGLLCGFRLATARDQNEFNEAGLRDALLGWPTLTYGFPAMRKGFFWVGNKLLNSKLYKGVKTPFDMLMKGSSKGKSFWNQSVRTTDEMQASFLKRSVGKLQQGETTASLLDRVKTTGNALTLSAAGISIFLLSYLEPLLGINWTNKLELARRREEFKELAGSIYDNTKNRLQLGADATKHLAQDATTYAKEHLSFTAAQPAFDPTKSAYYQQAQRSVALDNQPYFIPGQTKVAARELQHA